MANIANINSIDWSETENGDFSCSRKQIAQAAGGKQLGASVYKLSPGKKSFPFHAHCANEEAILVLAGAGSIRIGHNIYPINQGDYIALPTGKEYAHQVVNTSDADLEYICMSTMLAPEVMFYPDSDKVGVMTESAPGGVKTTESFKAFYQKSGAVDYFSGES